MKKSTVILLAVAVICAVLMAGCNPNTQDQQPGGGASSGSGGVLNLWDSEDPNTLDPSLQNEARSAQYIIEIFSGLVKLDESMTPVPDIARDWEVSGDGTEYTFHLRDDVKFQNGKGLTARDVKYSWERTTSPEVGSINAASYLGDIVGVEDKLSGKADQISGVKVLDDYTLQVTIDSPRSYFLYKLAYPTAMVMDRENVKSGGAWWRKPNGSGPFKLGQWREGQSLILERNEGYYSEQPKVDKIQYQFFTGLPMDLYEMGKIDVTPVYTSYIDKAMDQSGPFYRDLQVAPSLGILFVGFNCSRPPFNDAKIRRAFSQAIDKEKIITLVFRDMEKKAGGILPPGMPGYNAELEGLEYDIDKARELIREAGYTGAASLPEITFTTYGYAGGIGSVIEAILYQWNQNLGIKVKVRQLEPERYFYYAKEEVDNMFFMGWSADYPHPQDFLDILFHTGSNTNYGNYSNSGVDELIERANRSSDQAESFSLYQQAEQIMVNDAACIPISFSKDYLLVKPYVHDYEINPLGFATLDKVSIIPH
ncbi:MAG: peptide ABC transporter substrate-binding protein [Dehalococcoidales bacterium]|nr:peptide ABC transporter substrate-binding protein [Dehalococcoidales bacterium]